MSKFKEKSEYAAMKISGFLGWIHRLVMLITFPIRKFWIIVAVVFVVLAILIAIPMCYGIQLRDVWDWYMVKMPTHEFVKAKDKVLFGADSKIDEIKRTLSEIVPGNKSSDDEKSRKRAEKKKTQFVSWNVAKFRKAKYEPQKQYPAIEKVKEQVEEKVAEVKEALPSENVKAVKDSYVVAPAETRAFPLNKKLKIDDGQNADLAAKVAKKVFPSSDYAQNIDDYYVKLRSPDLSYLATPEVWEGDVKVIGPNSLYVDGKFVFLYGVYSNPRRHDVVAAIKYLQSVAEGKPAHCVVVAYSDKTKSATALCFVNGMLVNKSLVEHNLAQNVALK